MIKHKPPEKKVKKKVPPIIPGVNIRDFGFPEAREEEEDKRPEEDRSRFIYDDEGNRDYEAEAMAPHSDDDNLDVQQALAEQ